MDMLNVMIWNDATIKGNDVECVAHIDMHEVKLLVMAELQRRTGRKYQHCEIIGLTVDPIEVSGINSVAISDVKLS